MKDINLDLRGNVLPTKIDKIALVDADTLAFTAALNAEEEIMVMPKTFYSDSEWKEILDDPTYNPETGMMYSSDLEMAMERADSKILKILDATGCKEVELHFTRGKCFRYDIYPDYKANRKGKRAPAKLQEIKDMLCAKYFGLQHDDYEADDIVVYRMLKHPDTYIMVAIDKDVINSVEGRHYNYYESSYYNKDMKWVDVTADTVKVWPYLQCIIGDTSDNIIGPKGIGLKRAAKFVDASMSNKQLWKGVVDAFISKGMTEEDALLNYNLVCMHLLTEDGIKLMEVKDGEVHQRLTESE